MLGPTHRAFATTIAATTVVALSLPHPLITIAVAGLTATVPDMEELTAEVFVTIQKGTRYCDKKALFEPDKDVSFTAVRLALGRLMTDVKGLTMLATDLKGLMK